MMAVAKFESQHALVFNFDAYAGNYEREFCAYVTGATGECGVGEDMADLYTEDHPRDTEFWALSDRCGSEPDDNGCWRPTSIYHDKEVDEKPYYSSIIFLATLPTDPEMKLIVARAKQFCAERPDWKSYLGKTEPLTLKGVKLISNKVERVIKTVKQFDLA
jgi:hypothetical protein